MKKLKIMTIFGTRPEAIKMAPLIKYMEKFDELESVVVVTAQHREMLDQVLKFFNIKPDYDLDLMKTEQSLTEITARALTNLDAVIKVSNPDIILVHGDTTTTLAASLAGFYNKIPIGHVEAGLRTYNKYSPFPEEMNRQLTDSLTEIYFAPTMQSKKNLLAEDPKRRNIFVTGNTAIDAMKYTIVKDYEDELLKKLKNRKKILITMHRRENVGKPMMNVFKAVNRIVDDSPEVDVIFPIHKNPKVRQIADQFLKKTNQIHLIEPLDVIDFQNYCNNSYIILTDSGGVQEEAPSYGVPVLVLRDTTERPEGINAGTLKLIGTEEDDVYNESLLLIQDRTEYEKMANASNPYGDGKASERIMDAIFYYFGLKKLTYNDFSEK